MNIIQPFDARSGRFNVLEDCRNSIFLAGPCPREDFSDDWRFEAFDILEKLGFSGKVLTPTNENYQRMLSDFGMDKGRALASQTMWESAAMHLASAIVMWIPRSEAHPARTTNIEFGEWYKQPRVFVGWPDGAEHNEYIEVKLKSRGKRRYSTLESLLAAAVDALSSPADVWFTSDTHFCQERTMEFSRRPFVNVSDMDCTIASNWNKRVTMNDTVIHAGDFMDPTAIGGKLAAYLGNLNFKTMKWVLGNWDRDYVNEIHKAIVESGRDVEIFEGQYSFTDNGKRYVVVHEPNDFPIDAGPDDIVLFGHIHGRSFAKRNGFDLGIDYHRYSPINLEQVRWFAVNGMPHWDENVFSERANTVRA